jgi:hypothetical protein
MGIRQRRRWRAKADIDTLTAAHRVNGQVETNFCAENDAANSVFPSKSTIGHRKRRFNPQLKNVAAVTPKPRSLIRMIASAPKGHSIEATFCKVIRRKAVRISLATSARKSA